MKRSAASTAKKPVVAVVDGMAASGAYIAALGADRIFARGNSIVGSIGVLVEYPNFSGLMDKLGVKYEAIKSSPLKASPNGFEPTSDAARDAIAALVADSYAWFKDLVRDRRGMSDDELAKVSDGRVFDGRQGLPLKLIDAIGGEREAVAWLESAKGVAKELAGARRQRPAANVGGLTIIQPGGRSRSRPWACPEIAEKLRAKRRFAAPVRLTGLMSVWQL